MHQFPLAFETAYCRYGQMIFPPADQYVGRSLAEYGEFSQGEVDLFMELVKPGHVVVDAGANLGTHTVVFSRLVGPTGLVIAFEPQIQLYNALCGSLALNGITNVRTHRTGLSNRPGRILLPFFDYEVEGNFGSVSLDDPYLITLKHGDYSNIIILDSMKLTQCDFIKMDVEGMELKALEGMADLLFRLKPILYVENDRKDKSPALIQFLLDLGYNLTWHTPPLYNPNNYKANPVNKYPQEASFNILALPSGKPPENIPFMRPVDGPFDWNQC